MQIVKTNLDESGSELSLGRVDLGNDPESSSEEVEADLEGSEDADKDEVGSESADEEDGGEDTHEDEEEGYRGVRNLVFIPSSSIAVVVFLPNEALKPVVARPSAATPSAGA